MNPRVAALFAGAGGASLGYRMAGYDVVWANEFVPEAAATYRANSPGVPVDERDVRTVTGPEILGAAGLAEGDLDVLDGGPPCSSYSMTGLRAAGWGAEKSYSSTRQRTDDLFLEYVRLVAETRPRVFVAENVPGLARGVARAALRVILADMTALGYAVTARVLNASHYGVPQARQRLIFIGIRDDLDAWPVFPARGLGRKPSLRGSLPALRAPGAMFVHDNGLAHSAGARARDRGVLDMADGLCPTVTVGQPPGRRMEDYRIVCRPGEPGPEWRGDWPYCPETGRSLGLAHRSGAGYDLPHGSAVRAFTIPELRTVCGFPPEWVLTGTYAQRWERLGRALPPPMSAAIASTIRTELPCAA